MLGLDGPLAHGRLAQLTDLLDQQLFHLVGGLECTLLTAGDFQNVLHPGHDLGMAAQLFQELGFLSGDRRSRVMLLFHPDPP